jgi:hypothetical protein
MRIGIIHILALLTVLLFASLCPKNTLVSLQKRTRTDDSKIKIINKSRLNIDHIYLSPPDKNTWDEDDILGDNDILKPGESIVVILECGTWDVKLVLEDGTTCLGYDEVICNNEVWEINSADCDGDGRKDK